MSTEVIYVSAIHLQEWVEAKEVQSRGETVVPPVGYSRCRAWHPPSASALKINVDVAFFAYSNQTGVRMVIRDETGLMVLARSILVSRCMSIDEGKAMGFFETPSWIKCLELENMWIEGDVNVVVDVMHTTGLLSHILGLREPCKSILFKFHL